MADADPQPQVHAPPSEGKAPVTLEDMVQAARVERLSKLKEAKRERSAKKASAPAKVVAKKSDVTIIPKNAAQLHKVLISGLPPSVTADQITDIVQSAIRVQPYNPTTGKTVSVEFRNLKKAQELIDTLHGSHCKETNRTLNVRLARAMQTSVTIVPQKH